MRGASVDGRDGDVIKAVTDMLGRFTASVVPKLVGWEQQLAANPQDLDTIEHAVQQEFSYGAGLVVAGLVSVVMQTEEFAAAAEQTRQQYSAPLAVGRTRKMSSLALERKCRRAWRHRFRGSRHCALRSNWLGTN